MAYGTGTSTGPDDLLDKLRIFLIAQGYSVNQYAADGTGYRLHVEKTIESGDLTMYWNLRSATAEYGYTITGDNWNTQVDAEVTGLVINGSTDYDSGEDWDEQPGYCISPDYAASGGMVMTGMSTSSIPAYYFFAVGDSIHVVVETTAGHFQFMSFGRLVKQGSYTGGHYLSASFSSRRPNAEYTNAGGQWYTPQYFTSMSAGYNRGYVYVDVDGTADWRHSKGETLPEIIWPCIPQMRANGTYGEIGDASLFWSKNPNFYNNISSGCPIYTYLKRSDNNYSLLGWPEGLRFLNMSLYSAGQEVIYGNDTWKIFEELSLEDNSVAIHDNLGFAFLKET